MAISPKQRTLLDMKSRHNMVLRDELQIMIPTVTTILVVLSWLRQSVDADDREKY